MKYIIIDPEDGIFLGTTGRSEISEHLGHGVPDDARIIALFSSHNVFDITKAAAFPTEKDAKVYLHRYIGRRCPDAFVAPIETDDMAFAPYVDVVDIIRAGYSEYTEDMVDALPMQSQHIH